MTSEAKAPTHGAVPPHSVGVGDARKHLDRDQLGAFGDARERLSGRSAVTRGNAGHVRAVGAVAQRTWRCRTCSNLLVESVRAERLAGPRHRARITGLFHDFAGKKRMRRIDARVEHGNHRPGAVESSGPRLIALDEWNAVRKGGSNDAVGDDAHHVGAQCFERGKRGGADVEREVRRGLILMKDPMPTCWQS